MPSYAVTGASRGIGLGFIKALSAQKDNQVFAIIRNPATAAGLQSLAASHPNIHIVIGDATIPEDMDRAAEEVGKVTGGKLDVLINNVGGGGPEDAKVPGDYVGKPAELKAAMLASLDINVFSTLYSTDSFLPLIRAGEQKKIICISTGMADDALVLKAEIQIAMGYSMSKAALNNLVAKYAVHYKNEGIKFLALSPGWVSSHAGPEEDMNVKFFLPVFQKVYPELKGKITVEESVKMQLDTIENLTLEQSGQFLSHHGDKYWV